jgi:hypothetical protein
MLKYGLAALLGGLLVFGSLPATAGTSQQVCAMNASDCCCGAHQCSDNRSAPCISCVFEKTNSALLATQVTAKPRVSVALYFLPKNESAGIHSLFAQSVRDLNPSPPSGGPPHQALLRLWLI